MIKNVGVIIMTLAIPVLLFASVWQTGRYSHLSLELGRLDQEQEEIVAHNKRLISAITMLSVPERIERVAVEELNMRKAQSHEIMRIKLKQGGLGG